MSGGEVSDLIAFLTARLHLDEAEGQNPEMLWGETLADNELAERRERARREVQAKRAIIEECEPRPGAGLVAEGMLPLRILKLLAAVYSDHPDHDPAWAAE